MSTTHSEEEPSKVLATFGRRTFIASLAVGLGAGLALVPITVYQGFAIAALFGALCAWALAARRAKFLERENKALEERLSSQEKKLQDRTTYQALVERANVGFYRSSPAGRLLIVNAGLARILGFESAEQMKSELSDLGRLHMDSKRVKELKTLIATDGFARDFVSQVRRRDGSLIWIADNVHAIKDEKGQVLFYEGTVEDVTARKTSEEAVLRILRESREAARTKAAFLASMSHELKTPLNSVIGFADIMCQQMFGPIENEKYRSYLVDIHENGKLLLHKINDILDLTRAEGHLMDLQDDAVRVGEALNVAKNTLTEGKPLAVSIEVTASPDLPLLRADAKRVHQILVHILSNAIKFTKPGGKIDLKARIDGDGGMIIVISDTGIGMKPELVKQAMQPFRQLDARLERSFEGMGLGLPLANALLRLHGGHLTIESSLSEGTKVGLKFPADRTILAPKASAA